MHKKICKYLVILAVNFILNFSRSRKVDWYVVWWTADVVDSSRRQKGREAALYYFFINSLMVVRGERLLIISFKGRERFEGGEGCAFFFYLQKEKVEGSYHLHY